MNANTPPALPATGAVKWQRRFIWFDIGLCTLFASFNLIAIILTAKNGYQGDLPLWFAWTQLLMDISGNALALTGAWLLIRRQRSGFYFVIASLLVIGVRLTLQYVNLGLLIQSNSCPEDTLILGLILGTLVRICYNGLYLLAISTYRKTL
ncbi:hypothetical protein CO614_07820 [Lysobacteraceae bacterium NML120232]|nr:hypothetical protein CO608_04525 [Xanthomonadaceae bacterium NML08-0793]PJK10699.1 hypothetical protein CO614_07820 [Xanthomonadaceae bacterium NML120232]